MKKCPFCAEEIQAEAKKCKHCGEFLEPEKRQSKSRVGDFSGCRVLKENEGPANIRCPKCGFHGESRTIEGDYKPVLFWLFFFCFPVVGGLVYYYLTPKDSYICPHCGNDYVERIQ